MKNVLCFCLLSLFFGSVTAQKTNSTDPDKQLAIAAKDLQQFEEKTASFEDALDHGDAEKIMAVKLMIEQAMAQEIVKTKRNPSTNQVKRAASNDRAESGKQYLKNKKNRSTSKSANQEMDVLAKKEAIYQQFSEIKTLDGNNSIVLNKLMSSFHDTMETDLEQKKTAERKK